MIKYLLNHNNNNNPTCCFHGNLALDFMFLGFFGSIFHYLLLNKKMVFA